MKENKTLESLMSGFLIMQSKLEEDIYALESLIKIAITQAELENSDVACILDILQKRAENIKNTVFEIER